MVRSTEHCKLCDRSVLDDQAGLLCLETGRKAEFVGACNIFLPNRKLAATIFMREFELARALHNRARYITYIAINSFFGVLSLIAFIWLNYFYQATVIQDVRSTYRNVGAVKIASWGALFFCLLTISLIIHVIVKRQKKIMHKKEQLAVLHNVLSIYEITYDAKADLKNGPHGIIDTHLKLAVDNRESVQHYEVKFSVSESRPILKFFEQEMIFVDSPTDSE